ncbi:MAG: hypothetical protein J5714_04755 [Alphaproteobacteria bacterium]|nr:hypothetical protein [Alphaproteobacteria bacterium]
MKRFFGGFTAFFVGLYCVGDVACYGGAPRVAGTPQVVSNTFTLGGGCSSNTCSGSRYVTGTPVSTRYNGQGYVQAGYVSPQNYGQTTTYQQQNYRQPTTYQRVNYAGTPRYADGTNGNTRTMTYQQSRDGGRGAVSGSYTYNKSGSGYVGMNLDVNLLNWTNKYKATPEGAVVNMMADHDDYKFKPLIGGHFVAGYRFNPDWRADAEFGFTSEYEDSDNGITFKMSVPYVTANIYHDFVNGLYLGIGGGAAFPTISMEWENFRANDSSKTGVAPMGAAMLGYSYYLSESLIFDVRYRFAGLFGNTKIKRHTVFQAPQHAPLESLETKVGFIMDNSISIGLKYEF